VACLLGEDLVVWDRAAGKEVRHPKAAPDTPHGLAFSPDGSTLAVAGRGGVFLYAVPGGKRLHAFGAQPGWTGFVTFSPDGRAVVASGPGERKSDDGMPIDSGVYLWEAATGQECRRLPGARHQGVGAAGAP